MSLTADAFRKIALAFPGAIESAHMDHPDFRTGGKIFASLGYPADGWGMVKLTPEDQEAFVEKAPHAFEPCKGAWGKSGSTGVHLAAVTKSVLQAAMEAAFQNVSAPKKKAARRK